MSASVSNHIFLNLSIAIKWDGEESIDEICSLVKADIEFLMEDKETTVVSCSPDLGQATAFAQARSNSPDLSSAEQVQTSTSFLSSGGDVATVLARYSLTLPRVKKGGPEWRGINECVNGYPRGLPSLYGKLVLTDGIHGIVIHNVETNLQPGQRHRWSQIMVKNFIPDEWGRFDACFEVPTVKKDTALEAALDQF